MSDYYNENNEFCAHWLRNLIRAGHIPAGFVDERSIEDVEPDELAGYGQCHFFAGIAGWPLALRIARLSSAAGVWTGSPPCQDNSVAAAVHGGRIGLEGSRSGLAKSWMRLVEARLPEGITFENVPGIGPWLTEITDRLGQLGYKVHLPECSSAGVGAPHLRRRVWVVAHRCGQGFPKPGRPEAPAPFCDPRSAPPGDVFFSDSGRTRPMDDGLPSRVGAVHAYGNAIDPWAAAQALNSVIWGRHV